MRYLVISINTNTQETFLDQIEAVNELAAEDEVMQARYEATHT